MRQPCPLLFAPLRRLGDPPACCLSRPVLGTTPVQGSLWLPQSVSELAEFPCDVHHSWLSPPLFAQHLLPVFLSRISSAMLVRDRRTSSAKGASGRQERHDSAGMRLVTAASG